MKKIFFILVLFIFTVIPKVNAWIFETYKDKIISWYAFKNIVEQSNISLNNSTIFGVKYSEIAWWKFRTDKYLLPKTFLDRIYNIELVKYKIAKLRMQKYEVFRIKLDKQLDSKLLKKLNKLSNEDEVKLLNKVVWKIDNMVPYYERRKDNKKVFLLNYLKEVLKVRVLLNEKWFITKK